MTMLMNKTRFALLIALAVTALPIAAQAQRKSPLADAVAIRHRYELRSTRFEIGAGAGSTLNQDYFHTVFINVKAGFHINDWLSIGAFGDFGVANVATGFQNKLVGSLSDTGNPQIMREPNKVDAQASLQKISSILGGEVDFTPFAGKYSLFGKLFANYDLYIGVGGAGINVKAAGANVPSCDNNGGFSCQLSGIKPGFTAALGFHTFFNNFLALNVELRDVLASLNPAGRDTNGDLKADQNDVTLTHTWVLGANLIFYLPANAHISD